MYFHCYFCFSVPYAQALILQFAKSCFYVPMYVSAHNARPSHPICDIDTTYVECGYVYYVTTGKWSAGWQWCFPVLRSLHVGLRAIWPVLKPVWPLQLLSLGKFHRRWGQYATVYVPLVQIALNLPARSQMFVRKKRLENRPTLTHMCLYQTNLCTASV